MLIIADENIPLVTEMFSPYGEVRTVTGRYLTPEHVSKADVLLVRSVTPVNESLLTGSRVRFVGSATAGTNHVDTRWLERNRITFACAPGSNAVSAAEYVMSALLNIFSRDEELAGKTMGIIGCGNVGSRVKSRAAALGMKCLVCDPPRAHADGPVGFVSMNEVAQADVVTVHVPLVEDGPYATGNLVDAGLLGSMQPGAVLINTSRGGVLDEQALLRKLDACPDFHAVLDVWKQEPLVNVELAERVRYATPHIAGYSTDGKLRATKMLHQSLRHFLGCPDATSAVPDPDTGQQPLSVSTDHPVGAVRECLSAVYDIRCDDHALRETLSGSADLRAVKFDSLRRHYRPRRECTSCAVDAGSLSGPACNALRSFGFPLIR